jgi:large subunit ribosomal protein L9
MEVILREDVTGLGIIGDVVRVKPGFARNYLLPRGLAVLADRRNLRELEHHKRVIAAKKARERGAVEGRAAEIAAVVLETEVRAGKGGRLFGSVTNIDVARLLAERGFEIDRRRIELKDPIKEIGEFGVHVRVGQDVVTTLKIVVKPLGGELEDKAAEAEASEQGRDAADEAVASIAVSPGDDAEEPADER